MVSPKSLISLFNLTQLNKWKDLILKEEWGTQRKGAAEFQFGQLYSL